MKIDIFYTSKYGSTKTISDIINDKINSMENLDSFLYDINSTNQIGNAAINIVLSPIYGGFALKEFDDFLYKNKNKLLNSKIIIFAVALNKESCFRQNNLKIIENHKDLLQNIIYQDALCGERIFDNLDQDDKDRLLYFYKNIMNLSQEQILQKQKPFSFINKKDIYKSIQNALEKI